MQQLSKYFVLIITIFFYIDAHDVTIVGNCCQSDGLGKIGLNFINALKHHVTINVKSLKTNTTDVDPSTIKLINDPNKTAGNITVYTFLLEPEYVKFIPNSAIKIAYSMFESTAIPPHWVSILNKYFDAVVVPDIFLVEVYKNSGVQIPIFVLPMIIDIETFLNTSPRQAPHKPFVFASTGLSFLRKNHSLVLDSFAKAFGNNPNVQLKMHIKMTNKWVMNHLKQKIIDYRLTNVKIIEKNLTWQEYTQFMESVDCYICLSKGEGFSITPREAMALGIPCIISNNTAHTTICDSHCVIGIDAPIKEHAYYEIFAKSFGTQFNCHQDQIIEALKKVYSHYADFLPAAQKGREWVSQYTMEKLSDKYRNLVKPKKILLGEYNMITNEYLMTSCIKLYDKYILLHSATNDK